MKFIRHLLAVGSPFLGATGLIAIFVVVPYTSINRAADHQAPSAVAVSSAQPVAPLVTPIARMAASPVSLTTPAAGATYMAPASIRLSATVRGSFAQVEFYAGSQLLGIARTAPYLFTWNNVGSGTYVVTAVARNIRNAPAYSRAARVIVRAPGDFPLVQQSSLQYQGAFRLPSGPVGASSFGYGANIAYNAERDSLFAVGHDWHQLVAEVRIPQVRRATSIAELPTATLLQTFSDPTDGRRDSVNPTDPNGQKIGGLLPYRGRLLVSVYSFYDGANTQRASHFLSGRDLSIRNDATGPFGFSIGAGISSGYMGLVPPRWRQLLGGPVLVGNCCLSIISRTSYGPSVSSFNPADIGTKDPVPATTLLSYPEQHPLAPWDSTGSLFNGTSEVRGVVFPEGWRSVLFFGRHGIGNWCYGEGADCDDPEDQYKGTHAFPYVYSVWAYDALQLAEVRNGIKQPWQVQPYGVWQLALPFKGGSTHLNGAAYDPATGRIFLAVAFADGENPLILVYTLGG